jgi:hypothetical protein
MCHNGSKVASKFEKHYLSRLWHPRHSLKISVCDFWLSEMLKGVLKDREFNSNDEIEEVMTKAWDEFTFDEVHTVFHDWMSRLTWVIANGGAYIIE